MVMDILMEYEDLMKITQEEWDTLCDNPLSYNELVEMYHLDLTTYDKYIELFFNDTLTECLTLQLICCQGEFSQYITTMIDLLSSRGVLYHRMKGITRVPLTFKHKVTFSLNPKTPPDVDVTHFLFFNEGEKQEAYMFNVISGGSVHFKKLGDENVYSRIFTE